MPGLNLTLLCVTLLLAFAVLGNAANIPQPRGPANKHDHAAAAVEVIRRNQVTRKDLVARASRTQGRLAARQVTSPLPCTAATISTLPFAIRRQSDNVQYLNRIVTPGQYILSTSSLPVDSSTFRLSNGRVVSATGASQAFPLSYNNGFPTSANPGFFIQQPSTTFNPFSCIILPTSVLQCRYTDATLVRFCDRVYTDGKLIYAAYTNTPCSIYGPEFTETTLVASCS